MSSQMDLYTPEKTVSFSRDALRESVIFPLVTKTVGGIAEVWPSSYESEQPTVKQFDSGEEYRQFFEQADDSDAETGRAGNKTHLAIWLFGPERIADPSLIFLNLSASLEPTGSIIVASEVPWPGKILSSGEVAEYTTEEMAATLIRAGFRDVESIIEGPFFRITKAFRSSSDAHIHLVEAGTHLNRGDFAKAEMVLNSITSQMDSALLVREFALLIAACHDLAGRPEHALEALSEALTLDPRCARAMCGLGRIAALKGDLATARDFFESALRCEPALVAGLHGIAIIEEAQGNIAEAYKAMLTASDLRPLNEELMSEATRLGNQLGQFDDVARFVRHRLNKSITCRRKREEAGPMAASSAETM